MEKWIFPENLLLQDRQLELDQRKRILFCRRNATKAAFPQQSYGISRGSTTHVRAPQATAAYKIPCKFTKERVRKKTESKVPPLLELLL